MYSFRRCFDFSLIYVCSVTINLVYVHFIPLGIFCDVQHQRGSAAQKGRKQCFKGFNGYKIRNILKNGRMAVQPVPASGFEHEIRNISRRVYKTNSDY